MLGTRRAWVVLMAVCLWALTAATVGNGIADERAGAPVRANPWWVSMTTGASTTSTTATSTTTTTATAAPTDEAPPTTATATYAPASVTPRVIDDDPVPRTSNVRSSRAPAAAGRIIVPALGLDVDSYEGGELAQIDFGPSHMPHTAQPGFNGNTVFAGHRVTYTHPFQHLDRLVPGDTVTFVMPWGTFTYAFTHREIVSEGGTEILLQTARPTATLFACHPPGSSTHRIVARFDLVSSAAKVKAEEVDDTPLYDNAPGEPADAPPPQNTTPTTAAPSKIVLPGHK
jgi:sortase A